MNNILINCAALKKSVYFLLYSDIGQLITPPYSRTLLYELQNTKQCHASYAIVNSSFSCITMNRNQEE